MDESKSMKVIIVGAGIAGLSTYLFLKRYCEPLIQLDLVIYESYKPGTNRKLADATFQEISSSSLIVGGGLGVQPNGMRIIRDLGEELYAEIKKHGFLSKNFVFKSSRGWRLASSPGGDKRGSKGYPPGEEEFCLSVSRQGVRDSIFNAVGPENVVYKKVVKAEKAVPAEGKRASVVFEDGTKDDADLVIGADGVRSEVLRGIFKDEELVKPHYEGLIGVGGFIDGPIPDEIKEEESMVFVFGPNGFFGYGATSPTSTMWWSTCSAENVPAQRKISAEDMKAQLQARHGPWKDPIIKDILEHVDVTSIYPVWTLGDLPNWGSDGLVVLGDAAHALQPTSGQGVSQALEDSKCFPLLLSKFLERSKELRKSQTSKGSTVAPNTKLDDIVAKSVQAFYNIRAPRVKKIADSTKKIAQRKKDQSLLEELMLCGVLYTVGKVPRVGRLILGDVTKEMYYWPMDDLTDAAVDKLMPVSSA